MKKLEERTTDEIVIEIENAHYLFQHTPDDKAREQYRQIGTRLALEYRNKTGDWYRR